MNFFNLWALRVAGTKETRPRDKGPFSVEFQSKIAILSRLSLGRVLVCPWDDCPARAVRKMFMCFLEIGFFFLAPTLVRPELQAIVCNTHKGSCDRLRATACSSRGLFRLVRLEIPFRRNSDTQPLLFSKKRTAVGIPIAWYKAQIPEFPRNREGKEQVVQVRVALEQETFL